MNAHITATAAALTAHIEAISKAQIAALPEGSVIFTAVSEAEFWNEYGVYTPAQFDQHEAHCDYWEIYKDAHGISPRWEGAWHSQPTSYWRDSADGVRRYLELQAEAEAEAERQAEAERIEAERIAAEAFEQKPFTMAGAFEAL